MLLFVFNSAIFNNWFIVCIRPSIYGCSRGVAKHETSVRVWPLGSSATSQVPA